MMGESPQQAGAVPPAAGTTVELVRRHGGVVSHAALEPSSEVFRTPGVEGLVGYTVHHGCAVVFGDPVCEPEQLPLLADAFAAHAEANGWSVIYVVCRPPMAQHARERGYGVIEFAELLSIDPRHDPEEGPKGRHLRQNLNRTRREGVVVEEYRGREIPDPHTEAEMHDVVQHWLTKRHGLQMYLTRPRLFADRLGRRWFIARHDGRIVGVLSLLAGGREQCAHLVNAVFSAPEAPMHTSELLVTQALATLRAEEEPSICLGLAPTTSLGAIDGFNVVSASLARLVYGAAAKRLNLAGMADFWKKFGATHAEPLFLAFRPARVGVSQLRALARAFHLAIAF